jgi:Tol biopolymer transport system component
MALPAGTRLGAYEIVGLIGAGGMGEVFRARDSRLDRQVAIKALPDAFRGDGERAARFAREAKLLAALNHSNIATIHGLEQADGKQFIVMELVEGETLADRIARGPIPVEEALPIAKQIAEALEAAHEQGVIHRDLKPANIKLRSDGTVKVLDFGLAKALTADISGASSIDRMNSPTITSPVLLSGVGVMLGTAAYMSPEQAKGRAADKRSDVWAFGCVLYEMLTSKRAFDGEDVTDTLAAIVRGEPDWSALPPGLARPMLRLLRNCLHKDPHWRLQHIGDVRLELNGANEPAVVTAPPPPATSRRRIWAAAVVLSIASIAVGVIVERFRDTPVAAAVIQFTIAPPPDASFATPPLAGSGVASQVAISPDGKHLVFVANDQNGYRLWLRSLDMTEARPLSGTDGGAFPFWSPDSRFIAFFAAGKLKRVSLSGGPPSVICDAADGRGGTWNQDNAIVFTPSARGVLQRVSAGSGTPVDASLLNEGYGDTNHRFPSFLPDGRHFLFTAVVGTCCPAGKPGQIRIGSLDSMEAVDLLTADSAATYTAGYLLFSREGTLMAQAFDPSSRRVAGEPFRFVDGIGSEGSRYASLSASTNSVLVYGKGQMTPQSRLTWLDRTGRELRTVGDFENYPNITLSPDERVIAAAIMRGTPVNIDIYRVDANTGAADRLTFDPGNDVAPIWSPDSRSVVFSSQRSGRSALFQKAMVGTTSEDVLLDVAGGTVAPTSWSADGRFLLYTRTPFAGNNDIWVLPFSGDRKPVPFLETPAVETDATFSLHVQ